MAIRSKRASALAMLACAWCIAAPAAASPILLDWSPQALLGAASGNAYSNVNRGQHFGEAVSFAVNTLVDGMAIYSNDYYGALGTLVDIAIWADESGRPGALLGRFGSAIDAIDGDGASSGNVRKHAQFAGFTMLADVAYWIGMAGHTVELAQTAVRDANGGDGRMAQFTGSGRYLGQTGAGDMAFRLYGTALGPQQHVTIPLPGTLPLFALAGVGLAAARWRRSA
ncbi:hypothetical protein [Pseudoduganella chitinolytica]|uniref:VPLPA-CTERM sorting domain-containing protein n=1 Tax=Pseudoduganella chitinolytica TaxID=34070 RepID=A0ABY8BC72_9BURK|nr:hypothetical protein [Pseudoduganella chitinolytica]WEF32608.1 hypothetical protein PX653_24880 [Pseudoduganella chitinolytica]